jgi:U3 small nucleolar RNA-associated protein 10
LEVGRQVLLKTRSEDARVREAALCIVESFYLKLGEDFLALLPETVLYLSELLEGEGSLSIFLPPHPPTHTLSVCCFSVSPANAGCAAWCTDDDLEVERQNQRLIKAIEQFLGEPLSNYF